MSKVFLLEIGTEEIPAHFMPGILEQLEKGAQSFLAAAGVEAVTVRALGTPRRMALLLSGLPAQLPDRVEENRGPSVKVAYGANGEPSKAAQGFARGQGVAVTELVKRGDYVYAVKKIAGEKTAAALTLWLESLITGLKFPKLMHWSNLDVRFVRPVRWIVAMLDELVLPFTFAEVTADNKTRGHRFLSEGEVVIPTAGDYEHVLAEESVIVDPAKRKAMIEEQVVALAVQEGGRAIMDQDLLEEVVYLVEYPTALCGHFDEAFLKLPKEAVITPMKEHQRYFPVVKEDGSLLPLFITVRNGGKAHLEVVAHGNERVLRARLSDAAFFFAEDRKQTLEAKRQKLGQVVFQEGLGSMLDKTERLALMAGKLAEQIGAAAEKETVMRTARLSKADLTTNMVCEFTELQGVMGREYALLDGETPAVAAGIYEHYLPRFSGDELPVSTAGRLVSIADKLDNITATFSRGLIPSGSQDPYALRRQAQGVVQILAESAYPLALDALFELSMDSLSVKPDQKPVLKQALQDFFQLRVRNLLSENGTRHDLLEAVLASPAKLIADMLARAAALNVFSERKTWPTIVQTFTRVANLVKDGAASSVQAALFTHPSEAALYEAVQQQQDKAADLLKNGNYEELLALTALLAEPVNTLFDNVMVMAPEEDVKVNRLALLASVRDFALQVADLSKVVME